MHWVTGPYKRYFDFVGRSTRSEYWAFVIFWLVASTVLAWIDGAAGLHFPAPASARAEDVATGGLLTDLFALVSFSPGLAVAVRRLHDSNLSGWWVLLPAAPILFIIFATMLRLFAIIPFSLIPFLIILGFVAFIVLLCLPGTRGSNRFGSSPNEAKHVAEVFE
jgi:uncharacterized membrane protein YhaH (DUF805 family)